MSKCDQEVGTRTRRCCSLQKVHEFQEARDIDSILAAMRRLLSHGVVQQLGSAALKQIALDTEDQTLIFGAGSVRGVMDAMRRHKRHAGVQGAGCSVLCNVGVVAEHKQGIAWCGGIETVVEALREHPQRVAVQKQGLSALRILAVDEQVALKVANGGGIQLMADAMRTLPENAKVQQRACRALLQIGWPDAGVQARIRERGGFDLVERALRAPGATDKCRAGTTVRSFLCCHQNDLILSVICPTRQLLRYTPPSNQT